MGPRPQSHSSVGMRKRVPFGATEVGSLQQQLVIKGPWLPRLSPEVTECTVLYRQSQESCFFWPPGLEKEKDNKEGLRPWESPSLSFSHRCLCSQSLQGCDGTKLSRETRPWPEGQVRWFSLDTEGQTS